MNYSMSDRIRIIGKNGGRAIRRPAASEVKADTIRMLYPGVKPVFTTDFLVESEHRSPIITSDGRLAGYWCDDGVISMDHHGPEVEVRTQISSAVMVLAMVQNYGPVPGVILGTHKDTDTTVSTGMASGLLAPDPRFAEAAIAADHTGEVNDIADLLQSIQDMGELGDIAYSFYCLDIFLTKGEEALPEGALVALQARRAEREKLLQIVESGGFVYQGSGVYYAELQKRVDGELLPALLPSASVIVVAYPLAADKIPEELRTQGLKPYEVKTRTGFQFPAGGSLQDLDLPNWGGRWNAGGTGRHGGTIDPAAFGQLVAQKMAVYSKGD